MMRLKWMLALAEALLLVRLAVPVVMSSNGADLELYGQEVFSSQLDPVTGSLTSSLSYVLEVENSAASARDLRVRLTLHEVETPSLRVVAGELTMSQVIDLGRYVEVVVDLTAQPGRSSYEISGTPRAFPFEVQEEIAVNNGPPNVTTVGEYRFLSAKVGDSIDWKVRIRNTLLSSDGDTPNPPMPLNFVVNLDKKFFEVETLNPRPNSTTTDGSNYWVLFLKGESQIEVEAKVSQLSDWGVATVSPFIISYSSDQIPTMLQGMEARLNSLNATSEFLEGIWAVCNSSAGTLSDVSDYLGGIAQGVAATGNASVLLGESLMSASSAIDATILALENYSGIIREIQRLATEENINRTVLSLRGNISATEAVLEAMKSSIEQEQLLLIGLNQTLNSLLASENDTVRLEMLNQSIGAVSLMYQTNQRTLDSIDDALANLGAAETSLAGIDVRLVAEEVTKFVSFYASFESSLSALSSSLLSAGNASVQIGKASLNQSELLRMIADELNSAVNDTRGQLVDMWGVVEAMKQGVEGLARDVSDLSTEGQRVGLSSPELISGSAHLSFDVSAANETELLDVVPRLDNCFVKYIAFPNSSQLAVFLRDDNGAWNRTTDLASMGAWEFGGMTYLPIFSWTSGGYLRLGGQTEVRIVLSAGSEVSVYNGSSTSSLVEQASCSIFQPDIARTIGVITDGGNPPQPPPKSTTLGAEVLIGGLAALIVSFWILTRRRAKAMKEERRKRLEELDLGQRAKPKRASRRVRTASGRRTKTE